MKKRGDREREEEGAAGEQVVLPEEELVPGEEEGENSGGTALEEEAREPAEAEVLQQELVLLETQLQNMRDRYIRAVADLDNARKRARQAIAEARKQAVCGVLLDLLTLVDGFERALETGRPGAGTPAEARAVYDGVALIHRQLVTLLQRRGVRPIDPLGQPFDPSRHEAVAQLPATEGQRDGTVALEMQKGYMYGEEVLRFSKVGVVVHEAARGSEGE